MSATAPHLTAREVAARWKVTPEWVRTLARTQSIPGAVRIGSRWRFPLDAIEAWEWRHSTRDPLSFTDRAAPTGSRCGNRTGAAARGSALLARIGHHGVDRGSEQRRDGVQLIERPGLPTVEPE